MRNDLGHVSVARPHFLSSLARQGGLLSFATSYRPLTPSVEHTALDALAFMIAHSPNTESSLRDVNACKAFIGTLLPHLEVSEDSLVLRSLSVTPVFNDLNQTGDATCTDDERHSSPAAYRRKYTCELTLGA